MTTDTWIALALAILAFLGAAMKIGGQLGRIERDLRANTAETKTLRRRMHQFGQFLQALVTIEETRQGRAIKPVGHEGE